MKIEMKICAPEGRKFKPAGHRPSQIGSATVLDGHRGTVTAIEVSDDQKIATVTCEYPSMDMDRMVEEPLRKPS